MAKRALGIARIILEAEPEAYGGDPAAVERVTQTLAKVIGAFLAKTLVEHGDVALADEIERIAKAVEREAREVAATVGQGKGAEGDPPDTIN